MGGESRRGNARVGSAALFAPRPPNTDISPHLAPRAWEGDTWRGNAQGVLEHLARPPPASATEPQTPSEPGQNPAISIGAGDGLPRGSCYFPFLPRPGGASDGPVAVSHTSKSFLLWRGESAIDTRDFEVCSDTLLK